MNASTSPIFIVGANRSGTTLLRLILNAHSRIAIPEELNYMHSFMAGVPVETWRSPGLSPAAFRAWIDELIEHWTTLLSELDGAELRDTILHRPLDLRTPYATVLETWAHYYGKARWGEKTPGNLFYADVLHEMFPEARFIHMIRDPRAGVASMQKVDFFPGDVVFNALSRRKCLTEGRAILEDAVPSPQRYTLRYEDLVDRPATAVRAMCDFLGESFEPGMLAFHRGAEQYMKAEAATSFNEHATRPISSSRAESWRRELSPISIAVIERICGAEMAEHGYVCDAPSLPLARRLEIRAKRLYWAWKIWQHRRVRHYAVGYSLFARSRNQVAAFIHKVWSRIGLHTQL